MSLRRLPFSPWHLVLAPMALLFALPLLWLLVTSFMSDAQINRFPPTIVPDSLHLTGYDYVFTNAQFPRWFLNSTIVACTVVVSNLVLCSLSAYAFARMRFRGATALFALMLATLVIPFQLTMIPTFLIMKELGLINSLGALIVPGLVSAFGIFLLRQFFLALPPELEDAARIDGCSRLGVLVKVLLPLARPALTTLAVLTFLTTWNDLAWPLIAINSSEHYTLQLGLTTFQGQHRTLWSALMAGNVLTTAPVVIAFLLAQRTFIQSLTWSAVKG
ncbi:carbohydrate ABC transporter permease [Conexibacter woesei]|uniref:Binding-protein-dependent transport systems inner membrane component n=1 Tax=Conexibacter woesei (strain DSM 14684 / CCUG 47730 / CIP 108061 / JCM 11494 / NBRC 100937 / ID131577) TaxID=469383 RepID=D3F3K7_CONWI|nr:carbohydrate ABC transporter permease [Conexibacter woesei]ADB52372.1 binding-protein-dependent transport systems inner membrane component [Conexibacter woesei DSM 14684]